MQERPRGNEYRTTVVCIDSYDDKVPVGRFYNPIRAGGTAFSSMPQFLIEMEDLLDGMKFPQSFDAVRGFTRPPVPYTGSGPAAGEQDRSGKLATFAVRVIFRQNASWQGSVTWLEGGQEESFRSVLELVLLMDSALCSEQS